MKKLLLLPILCCLLGCGGAKKEVRVALITLPHGYDQAFLPFLDSLEGIAWQEYPNPAAQELFRPENADKYDVLLFYDMCPDIPDDRKADLVNLVKGGKPVFILHHGMGTYNDWPEFSKIAGTTYIWSGPKTIDGKAFGYSSYREEVPMEITVADRSHYITEGLEGEFTITDEVYGNMWQSPDIHALWTTDNPESSPILLYTHRYGQGKVVGLVIGHGPGSFDNPNYKTAFNRALLWLAE